MQYFTKEPIEEIENRIRLNPTKNTVINAPAFVDITSEAFKEKVIEIMSDAIKNQASLRCQIRGI